MHAGTKGLNQRRSDELLDSLTAGGRLIVSELGVDPENETTR